MRNQFCRVGQQITDVVQVATRAADPGDQADEQAAVRAVRLQTDPRQTGGGGDGLRQHSHLGRHDTRARARHDLRTRHRVNLPQLFCIS